MSLEESLKDLQTVLKADVFSYQDGEISVESLHVGGARVEQMRKLVRRDKKEIGHTRDVMNIKYRWELGGWMTQAGNYVNLRSLDVQRFNTSYEHMLAYYAGRVVDQAQGNGAVPEEVVEAQRRFMQYRDMKRKIC